ncbi:hypothetical protein POF50_016945 [Streptomyces sp. SL13]|uniref:Uncharacterized protein n=1 Tax=Streptantibioticus silvisoli TaxID=2705255 RepID=A0AA90KH59_9ACTN|nr:hypothetical protein [Streptantibioticus silvisoli]MDI5961208.1 hypothetical protein [Streptantibioticus silvisoli]MDI5971009.1 hypothetical protein [Streptantibioticus silvisoli]
MKRHAVGDDTESGRPAPNVPIATSTLEELSTSTVVPSCTEE